MPLAITVALIIATMKGSMVAARVHAPQPREEVDLRRADADRRRLHRPDDGAELCTIDDSIGTPIHVEAPAAEHARALRCRCGRFTWCSSRVSVMLAAFVAAWAVQQYQAAHAVGYAVTAALSLAAAAG